MVTNRVADSLWAAIRPQGIGTIEEKAMMYAIKGCRVCFIIVCTLSCQAIGGADADEDVASIVDAYTRAVDVLRKRISFDSETVEVYEGAYNWSAHPKSAKCIATTWRHNGSVAVDFAEQYTHEGPVGERRARTRKVQSVRVDGVRMVAESINDHPWNGVDIEDGFPKDFTRSGDTADGAVRSGCYLGGCGPAARSLVDTMRQGSVRLRDEMEVVDGHRTYVLEAESQYGKHTLWIDPEYGYNPRRIHLLIEADNLYIGDEPLGASPGEPPARKEYLKRPWAPIDFVEINVDSIEVQKIGGQFVPISANIDETTRYSTGEILKTTATHKRTNINLNPDFEAVGAFELDIPDGVPVYYHGTLDVGGVPYEWFNGKPRAYLDELVVDAMDAEVMRLSEETAIPGTMTGMEVTSESKPAVTEDGEAAVDEAKDPDDAYHIRVLLPLCLFGLAIFGGLSCYRLLKAKGVCQCRNRTRCQDTTANS